MPHELNLPRALFAVISNVRISDFCQDCSQFLREFLMSAVTARKNGTSSGIMWELSGRAIVMEKHCRL